MGFYFETYMHWFYIALKIYKQSKYVLNIKILTSQCLLSYKGNSYHCMWNLFYILWEQNLILNTKEDRMVDRNIDILIITFIEF